MCIRDSREPFPEGHERWGDEDARRELHRTGHADADGQHLGRVGVAPGQQVGQQLGHAAEKLIRAGTHVGRFGGALQDGAAEVGQRHVDACLLYTSKLSAINRLRSDELRTSRKER